VLNLECEIIPISAEVLRAITQQKEGTQRHKLPGLGLF
jgi:hypothetical protein